MGDSLNKLARLAHDTGDLERALTLALESAGLYDDLDCKWGVAESLEALAGALAAQGRAPDAVRLLGAGEGLREFIGVPLPPTQRPDHQRAVNDARRAIRDGWKAIWAEGRTMSAEQAVDYVRQIAQWSPQKALTGGDGSGPGTAPLSRREQEVARLIVQGCSNRQISELLVISERTTEAHVTHVLSKLGLRSRAQIAVWATQQGFLAASPSGQSEARVTSALGSA
jgi:non-specific serine/threonine protein kinase